MLTEHLSVQSVRASEEEIVETLNSRRTEEINHDLTYSIYDTARNEKALKRRKELERLAIEDAERRADQSMDYVRIFKISKKSLEKLFNFVNFDFILHHF